MWAPVAQIWDSMHFLGLHDISKTHEKYGFLASFDQFKALGSPPSCKAHPVPGLFYVWS